MSFFDYFVIALYFVFIGLIGWAFRRFLSNTSDYFRGGGQMLWWMAGSSAFMTQFSAWTFIGAASKAYEDGLMVLTIFIANAAGFFVNYLVFAARMRQTRLVTGIQVIRQRFGPGAEQLFTWLEMPIGLMYAAIWLNALGKFMSQAFPGFGVEETIVATGLVVLVVSAAGGAWAVSATDFIQMVLLMLLAVVTAALALWEVGGPVELAREFPAESIFGNGVNLPLLAISWMFFVFLKQILNTNKMVSGYRYLTARDSGEARKAALLASSLFMVGSVIWFIPPMAAAVLYPDLSGYVAEGVSRPSELSYAVVAQGVLPTGMIGLLVVGIFAATMSSMDSGLNRNAGIFILNFYKPILRKNASERELFVVSQITSIIMGLLIIVLAVYLESVMGGQKAFGLFELMLKFGAMVAVPIGIPIIFGLYIRRAPDWSTWSCALMGLLAAFLSSQVFHAGWFQDVTGLELTPREISDYNYIVIFVLGAGLPTAWFFISCLFYREPTGRRAEELKAFWNSVETPVYSEENEANRDYSQCRIIGWMSYAFGGFMLLLMVITPNSLGGRASFLFCGGVLCLIGFLLTRQAKIHGADRIGIRAPTDE